MEVKELPVRALVELSALSGETLRKVGTIGRPGVAKCVVAADAVGEWESVSEETVRAEAEAAERERAYRADVAKRIRARYSVDDEAAILRKTVNLALAQAGAPSAIDSLSGGELEAAEAAEAVLEEFEEYNGFAEECKREARAATGWEPGTPRYASGHSEEDAESSSPRYASGHSVGDAGNETEDIKNNE